MPSATYLLFRQAILSQAQVACIYKGRTRELCPHVLGHKEGQEKVLAFQFAGETNSGLPPGGEWRCLTLADVRFARMKSGTWHSGPTTAARRLAWTRSTSTSMGTCASRAKPPARGHRLGAGPCSA